MANEMQENTTRKRRIFAIINYYREIDIFDNIISKLPIDRDIGDKVVVFSSYGLKQPEDGFYEVLDIDSQFNRAVAKNYVLRTLKNRFNDGFAYVFEDPLVVVKDKFEKWIPDQEEFMTKFKQDVWLNTVLDECNYIFDKYVTRVNIEIDNSEYNKLFNHQLGLVTNANTKMVVYNLDNIDLNSDVVFFVEDFEIPMFYIIEFLARRRNLKHPGSFMNFYFTMPSEKGILKTIKNYKGTLKFNELINVETKRFEQMKVDYHPDMDVDLIMKFIEETLKKND